MSLVVWLQEMSEILPIFGHISRNKHFGRILGEIWKQWQNFCNIVRFVATKVPIFLRHA